MKWLTGCLRHGSIVVKGHHGYRNSYQGKHLTDSCLEFQRFSHCHHGREHRGKQAMMGLEKQLRVVHPDQQAARTLDLECDF